MKKINRVIVGGVVMLACASASAKNDCWFDVNDTKPKSELDYPGYFDVSAGFSIIPNATKDGRDSAGVMASFKAYPFGRWYAPKTSTAKVAKESIDKLAAASKAAEDVVKGMSDKTDKAESNNPDKLASDAEKVKGAAKDGGDAIRSAWADFEKIKKDNSLYSVDKYECRNRLSFIYSHSLSGFDGISGAVDAVGLSYDITPEFAVFVSRAFYKEKETVAGTGEDTRAKWMFGIEMNLNAFSAFRSLSGGN